MSPNKAIALLATSALATCLPVHAQAQETVASDAPANASESRSVDGDIIVTAQRREQRLQDVPAAISAFSADDLEMAGVDNIRDITFVAPSVNIGNSSVAIQPTIRGIGLRGAGSSDESVVPVYIDGILQPFQYMLVYDLASVERVEVLRGPQGALLGRNATGGAINIITRSPQATPAMDLSLSYGRFNEIVAQGYATVGNDVIAADVALMYKTNDGYLKHKFRPDQDTGFTKNYTIRSKVALTPSDDFKLTASYMRAYQNSDIAQATIPYDGNSSALRLDPNLDISHDFYEVLGDFLSSIGKSDQLGLVGEFDLGGVSLTSVTGRTWANFNQRGADNDGTQLDINSSTFPITSDSFSQEVYLASETGGPFSWIVGGMYFENDVTQNYTSYSTNVTTGVPSVSGYTRTDKTKSWAVYAQGRYELDDHLAFTLSGRYTHDWKSSSDQRNGVTHSDSESWSNFSPQAVLEYRFNPDVMVYAKAGRAFKAGVYSATASEVYAVDPEKVTQYEIGIKSDPLPWLRLNLAAYYTDYKDIQVNYRTNTVPIQSGLENAGAAEIYGLEAEFVVKPIDNLDIRGGVGLTYGKYTDYENASVYVRNPAGGNTAVSIDATGNKLIRVPEQTYSLGFNYTVPLRKGDIRLGGNIYRQSKLYWEASNQITTPGFTQVNGELSWSPEESLRIAVWVENLLDQKRYLHTLTSPTADTASYRPPRTYGVRLSSKF